MEKSSNRSVKTRSSISYRHGTLNRGLQLEIIFPVTAEELLEFDQDRKPKRKRK